MSQHRLFSAALIAACGFTCGLSELLSVPTAQATEASAAAYSGSLSVTGVGQVTLPADQAVIILTYYPNSDASDSSSTQSQVRPSDLKTVVDALSGAGVPAGSIKAFVDPNSPGSIRVRLVVDQPNQAKLEQAIDAANTAVGKSNRYTASGASVGYTVKDCAAAEAQARQAAASDAQNRAEAIAKAAGVQVGRVSSLSESVTWGSSYSTTCPVSNDPTTFDSYSLPAYDPSVPPVVKLIYSLSAGYNIH